MAADEIKYISALVSRRMNMSYDRRRLRGDHPPACTCVDCEERRRWRLPRVSQRKPPAGSAPAKPPTKPPASKEDLYRLQGTSPPAKPSSTPQVPPVRSNQPTRPPAQPASRPGNRTGGPKRYRDPVPATPVRSSRRGRRDRGGSEAALRLFLGLIVSGILSGAIAAATYLLA